MANKPAPKKVQSKIATKKAAPKKAAQKINKISDAENEITVKPHGQNFIVTEKSADGGAWKQSIENENPLEGEA